MSEDLRRGLGGRPSGCDAPEGRKRARPRRRVNQRAIRLGRQRERETDRRMRRRARGQGLWRRPPRPAQAPAASNQRIFTRGNGAQNGSDAYGGLR
ncbi:hypothetical protein MTO96_011959 [Rhipicephalus appendiculatus]